MVNPEEDFAIKEIIRRIALINAISHKGKAQTNPVLGKLLSEKPELKKRIGTLTSLINEVVQEINEMSLDKQREIVSELWPEMLAKEKEKVEEKKLPPLPNVEKYRQVVTRFAPNPDCVLHLGSARAIILSHEYARIYNGVFILRFEDTDPRLKKSALQFFDLIRRDLEWLGCNWDAEYIQSDRIEIYYEYAEKLLENGHAYVCICRPEEFRELIKQKRSCLCRNLPKEKHLSRWDAMLNGEYEEGEAVVRIKTDLDHPNPAIRDWPAFRVIDTKKYPHPRIGSKYRVWPLYNFASGIDDHLMSVSHIIRGKEHLTNQRRQEYLYRYLGWEYPEAMHYGRLKIEGASLSKSKILRGVKEGTYKGWDDPRLATFLALRRRGIMPEAIRRLIIDIGPRPVDITLSWENLYAYNRKIVDPLAYRFFFVQEPVKLIVKGIAKNFIAHIPLHPDYPEKGSRIFEVKPKDGVACFLISNKDANRLQEGSIIRLMELFNIQIGNVKENEVIASFHSETYDEARKLGAQLIHWIPEGQALPFEVMMPDGSTIKGLVERKFEEYLITEAFGDFQMVVQFERFGFVGVDNKDGRINAFFAHK